MLERGRFGLRTTALGAAVYPAAKAALEALDDVTQVVERSRAAGGTDLRLSASHTMGEFLLPGWLAEFRRHRPEIHPQLEIVNSRGVIDAVRGHRTDVGFVEGAVPLDGLDTVTVARDELVAVVAAEYPWARRQAVTARALIAEPYLTREAASGTRTVAAAGLSESASSWCPRCRPPERRASNAHWPAAASRSSPA